MKKTFFKRHFQVLSPATWLQETELWVSIQDYGKWDFSSNSKAAQPVNGALTQISAWGGPSWSPCMSSPGQLSVGVSLRGLCRPTVPWCPMPQMSFLLWEWRPRTPAPAWEAGKKRWLPSKGNGSHTQVGRLGPVLHLVTAHSLAKGRKLGGTQMTFSSGFVWLYLGPKW